MKLILILLSLSLVGCHLNQNELKKSEEFCSERGGVYEIKIFGSRVVFCKNGESKDLNKFDK